MIRFLTRPVALALIALSPACFYDSSWGARKTAQQHNAALATPAALAAPTASRAPVPAEGGTVLKVRVHASPAYEAQTPDWRTHVAALLGEASLTLQATLGARLVLETADDWSHVPESHLEGDLRALRDDDTGDGVDLVIGLIGGLPLVTQSFDQIGFSEVRGKHLVVRAPNVASEYDSVEKAFDELKPEQRQRLLRERLRHREVAVLLHEIGHALGATHTTVAASLMRPVYDPKMSAFDEDAIARMRRGLSHDTEAAKVVATPEAAPTTETPDAAPSDANAPSELSAADRERWSRASDLAKAGDAHGAWTMARPLFAAYPQVYGVQDLRCKLALAHFGSYGEARAECAPLMNASMAAPKKKN